MLRRITLVLPLICLLIIFAPINADTPTIRDTVDLPPVDLAAYPTVAALQSTVIQPANRLELAHRFLGLDAIKLPPPPEPDWQIGAREWFWVSNTSENRAFQVEAVLLALSDHVAVWVDTSASVSVESAQAFAAAFDAQVYEQARELWGSEPFPGVDGDPRIHAVFAHGLGRGVAAYYSSQNSYPAGVFPQGNARDMLTFNLNTIGNNIAAEAVTSIASHEFQHMIRHAVDSNESAWVDEGFSMFTEHYLGLGRDTISTAISFINEPQTQLNDWGSNRSIMAHYGAGLMFINYFFERYGLQGIQQLSAEQADGLQGVDNVLRSMGEAPVEVFFADWVLANALPDSSLGYDEAWHGLAYSTLFTTISSYPALRSSESHQYATDYYLLQYLDDTTSLNISLAIPQEVALLDTDAIDGDWFWYSNRADDSHMTLSQSFDLTDVDSATLQYSAWYDIEDNWDYAYVTISADGGETWDILSTPQMTANNPHGKAYGLGYSGQSNGWINQSISLDAYAGHEAIIQFEIISDDATIKSGLAIDSVSIPEIGYESSFETDDGGWESSGWVRTDNRLPQQAWVQAVQINANHDLTVSRWLAPQSNNWTLPLEDDTVEVLLAISPFARTTSVMMPYTLSIAP